MTQAALMIENLEMIKLNPLTLRSDQHVTSPCNIHTLSSKQVVRMFNFIRYKILT